MGGASECGSVLAKLCPQLRRTGDLVYRRVRGFAQRRARVDESRPGRAGAAIMNDCDLDRPTRQVLHH